MLAVLLLLAAQAHPGNLAVEFQRAQDHMAAGRFREAIPLYADLVQADPGNPRLLMNLGVAQHMTGDDRAAIPRLQAALKLDPNLFQANLVLGLAQLNLGRPALAIPPLRKALVLEPSRLEERRVLAEALNATGQFEEGAAEFRIITDRDPSNAKAWYALGRTWMVLSLGAHRQLFGKAPPDSAYALAVTADVLMRRQQFRPAFALFREALSKDPDLVSARAALAQIYRDNGHPDWAAAEQATVARFDCASHKLECDSLAGRYQAVLAATRNAQTPAALYWRAQAYTALAYQAFARLEQLPPSPELHRFKAGLHWEAERPMEMVEELRKAHQLAPQDREISRDFGMALSAAGDFEAAYRIARELLRDEPESPELNALEGDALLGLRKAAEAIPFLQKSVASNPGNLATHASLARALMQTGAVKLALPHLQAAAPTDFNGSLHYLLARAYRETGQPELAQQALAKYQELSAQRAAPPPQPEITPP